TRAISARMAKLRGFASKKLRKLAQLYHKVKEAGCSVTEATGLAKFRSLDVEEASGVVVKLDHEEFFLHGVTTVADIYDRLVLQYQAEEAARSLTGTLSFVDRVAEAMWEAKCQPKVSDLELATKHS